MTRVSCFLMFSWTCRRHADIWIHPVTIWQILTPHLGHQEVTAMVMNADSHSCCWMSTIPSIPEIRIFSKFDHESLWSKPCLWSKLNVTSLAQNPNNWLPFRFTSIGLVNPEILEFKGHDHDRGQNQWLPLRWSDQSIHSFFNFWQSDLFLVTWQSDHFCLRYSKFHIWPWKFKVKVTKFIDWNLIRYSVSHGYQSCQNERNVKSYSAVIALTQVCSRGRRRRQWRRTNRYETIKSLPLYRDDVIMKQLSVTYSPNADAIAVAKLSEFVTSRGDEPINISIYCPCK